MNRRRFLASALPVWLVAGSGCLSRTGEAGGVPTADEPPYQITEPACDDGQGERDPRWLCGNMPAEPSVAFEQEPISFTAIRSGLDIDSPEGSHQFEAALFTSESDLSRFHRYDGESTDIDLVDGTDFSSEALLVVLGGWGSGSVDIHFERVEETDDGVHAHGCYTRPCVYTDDFTGRGTAVRFERPDSLQSATVSLTVDVDERYTFAADEGVMTVPDET